MKTLQQWLLKLEKLYPKTIEMGLDRIKIVAHKLSLTKFTCPVIMIAGTNGKGSCVELMASIGHAHGYRVGAYTSPHLLRFNERIAIDRTHVEDAKLMQAFETVENARGNVPLTFFEFTTLAALWIFQQVSLDLLLLEVGLGGRLDAVNIVDADIAIIASIDIDHIDWLGSTREEIGREKAGIFRPFKLAICGDSFPPESVHLAAKQLNSPLLSLGRDFHFQLTQNGWKWSFGEIQLTQLPLPSLSVQNAAIALTALYALTPRLSFNAEGVAKGIKKAFLKGRFQRVENCILDVAHNPASAKLLALNCQKIGITNVKAVVGMLADKDIRETLAPLLPFVSAWYIGDLNVPRGAKAVCLAEELRVLGAVNCYAYGSVSAAFEAARAHVAENTLIFGSFYTVAEVLHLLENVTSLPFGC